MCIMLCDGIMSGTYELDAYIHIQYELYIASVHINAYTTI